MRNFAKSIRAEFGTFLRLTTSKIYLFRPEMGQNRPCIFSQFFAPIFREIFFAKSSFAFREISRNVPLYMHMVHRKIPTYTSTLILTLAIDPQSSTSFYAIKAKFVFQLGAKSEPVQVLILAQLSHGCI